MAKTASILFLIVSLSLLSCKENTSQRSNEKPPAPNANIPIAASSEVIEFPLGNPVKNGVEATVKNVTFTLPTGWKRVPSEKIEYDLKLAPADNSTDSIYMIVRYFEKPVYGDESTYIAKQVEKMNPKGTARKLDIGKLSGILVRHSEDSMTWLSTPPKEKKGEFVSTVITMIAFGGRSDTAGRLQLMSDILYSVRLEK